MKVGRKPGVVRRPIEYILITVAVLLAAFLLWAVYSIRQQEGDENGTAGSDSRTLRGSQFEIEELTEDDILAEQALDGEYDKADEMLTRHSDGAADNIGGVYDESDY